MAREGSKSGTFLCSLKRAASASTANRKKESLSLAAERDPFRLSSIFHRITIASFPFQKSFAIFFHLISLSLSLFLALFFISTMQIRATVDRRKIDMIDFKCYHYYSPLVLRSDSTKRNK